MQFKVPQFLDIEDKIFGPFTFKEFIYLVGGGGMCFILYKLLGLFWGAIPILAVASFALALTFYKPNNKPFINMIESGFNYLMRDKLYVWKKRVNKINPKDQEKINQKEILSGQERARLGSSKLRDLAWSLDVLDINKNKK